MEHKKRILFVMDGMKIGGVESALISVFHHLDFHRYDVDLLLLHDYDDLKAEIPDDVQVYSIHQSASSGRGAVFFLFWMLSWIAGLCRLRNCANRFSMRMRYAIRRSRAKALLPGKYETVIAYKHGEAESFAAFCIKAKNKILFYHHGSVIDDNLHRRAFEHFQKIVAVSDGVGEMLAEHYPDHKEKICVIPNFVDPDYVKQKAAAYTVDRPDVPLVLCTVGRLSPEKNLLLALRTAAELKERRKRFVWYIVGGGEQREELETYRDEHALAENVTFTGALVNPLPYVSLCDVYVQPSDVESYGLSIQEALILEKPVVSTKTIGGELLLTGRKDSALADADPVSVADGIENLWKVTGQKTDEIWRKKDAETGKLWRNLLNA